MPEEREPFYALPEISSTRRRPSVHYGRPTTTKSSHYSQPPYHTVLSHPHFRLLPHGGNPPGTVATKDLSSGLLCLHPRLQLPSPPVKASSSV